MYQNVERYIDFLAKNYLTQNQYLMLYLLRNKDYESINKFKAAFPQQDGSMIGDDYKKDLIDRGFIRQVGGSGSMNDYEVTEKFNHIFLKNHFLAADEIWAAYPSYASITGKNIPLKTMDIYKFANTYAERIKNSVDEHLEVLKDVKFGIDRSLINCGIEKFVTSELWKQIREVRLNDRPVNQVTSLTDEF